MGTSQKADNRSRPQFVVPLKCFRLHLQNVGHLTQGVKVMIIY